MEMTEQRPEIDWTTVKPIYNSPSETTVEYARLMAEEAVIEIDACEAGIKPFPEVREQVSNLAGRADCLGGLHDYREAVRLNTGEYKVVWCVTATANCDPAVVLPEIAYDLACDSAVYAIECELGNIPFPEAATAIAKNAGKAESIGLIGEYRQFLHGRINEMHTEMDDFIRKNGRPLVVIEAEVKNG
jgi:hypothetical protein